MIKIVNIDLDNFEKVNNEYVLNYFRDKEFIEVDTETKGFDYHNVPMICFQLGDFENQFVINKSEISYYKELLEEKCLIFQNAKFDLKFFYVENIFPNKIWDTFLAESIINCGLKTIKKDLASIAKRRLNIDLDKSVRENIWNKDLTKEVVEYAANDVKYLQLIKKSQEIDLQKLNLTKALEIDNEFVKVLAYIEYCGFKLDVNKWKAKCDLDLKSLKEAENKLNKFVIQNNYNQFIQAQLDLFSTEKTCTINWASSKQVIEFFEFLKIPVEIVEKGEKKKSVEAQHIEKYAKKYPIVDLYLDYKEKDKVVSTYGQNFINQINKKTRRLHTNFKQIMDTGRLSSGGKNKETREAYLNFQNIPSDKKTRNCFVAEKGNKLVIADYSGQEQIVLANKSMDENLLKFYDEGLADMHSFVASKMYPELENLSLDEIKSKYKDKRQEAKIAGFAINYGGVGATIAAQLNKSIEDGERVYNAYFKAFPGLAKYFEKVKNKGLQDGFVLISEETGRKSFIDGFKSYQELSSKIDRNFWEKWKLAKKNPESSIYQEMKQKIQNYFKIKGMIERKSLNYPIQGTSAEITKLSCIYFFDYLKQNNLLNTVLFVNTVHDENVVECPEYLAEEISKKLQECMEKSGELYCKRVKLKAEPVVSDCWEK